jgi:hypothetical protein
MSRLILHVGPEKCGSSSIQNAIFNNKSEISEFATGVVLNPPEVLRLNRPSLNRKPCRASISKSTYCYNQSIHQAQKRMKSPDPALEAALYMNEYA